MSAVSRAFADAPLGIIDELPSVSVVVCTHNGERTLRETLEGSERLRYSDYDVIVVNDGSTDKTALVVGEYDFRLINTANRGLSAARNTGLRAAAGEIVAYIDDDAVPDTDWLWFLAHAFRSTTHAVIGGSNLPPDGDVPIADCVANAPGGPIHVLASDDEAEQIPGCNMAFRRDTLIDIVGVSEVH